MEQAQQMAENGEMQPMPDQKIPQMTQKEMQEMEKALRDKAKQLEELAKKLQDPKAMQAMAAQMLAAAKAAKELGECNGLGMGIGMGMGLGMGMGQRMMPSYGAKRPRQRQLDGAGGKTAEKRQVRAVEGARSSRTSRFVSQIGENGPETYIEVTGPAQLNQPSAIPYQKALPKYEKSAESALNKGEIPAKLKGKVRNYFDSLRR